MNQLSLAIKLLALLASLGAAAFIYKQKLSYFSQIRTYMAASCLTFSGMITFSLFPQTFPSLAQTFERTCVTLALFSAILAGLSSASMIDYPEKKDLRSLLNAALERRDKLFHFYLVFEALGVIITWIPAFLTQIPQLQVHIDEKSGLIFVVYEDWFSLYLLICIILVWIYPVSKFLIYSKGAKDSRIKTASIIFGTSMFMISSSSLIFNVLFDMLLNLRIPFVSPLVTATSYLAIAYAFRKSTILVSAFEVFSQKLGLKHEKIKGERILLEFDPSSNYSLIVRDFIIESLAHGEEIYIFTTPNSALHRLFKKHAKVKFYLLSTQTTTIEKSALGNEILVPLENLSILLGKIREIASVEKEKCIIFDNLSILAFHSQPAKIYKFLTYMMEETSTRNITILMLFNPKAHDEKFVSAIRTIFNTQLSYNLEGLKTIKTSYF